MRLGITLRATWRGLQMTRLMRNTSFILFLAVAFSVPVEADPAEECMNYLWNTCGTVNFYAQGAYDFGSPEPCSGSCPTYNGCCSILCDMWGGVGGVPWCEQGIVMGGCVCD
jgi:hypothetical protein